MVSIDSLKRTQSTGNRAVDDMWDKFHAAIRDGVTYTRVIAAKTSGGSSQSSVSGSTGSTTPPDSISLVTRGKTTFLKGEVIGISNAVHVRAQAGVTRGLMVCTGNSAPGATLAHASYGNAFVNVEDGVLVEIGQPAYLSASAPGRVTSVEPNDVQLMGVFFSTINNGQAIVQLHIDLSRTSK